MEILFRGKAHSIEVAWGTGGQGIVEVTVTAQGCAVTVSKTVAVVVGIGEIEHTVLRIFPNPASGNIRVSPLPTGISTIELLDISGSVVATFPDASTISVTDLP